MPNSSLRLKTKLEFKGHVIKILWDSDWEEYIVRFYKDGVYMAESDYYTDDKEDALDTAKATLYAWTN